MEEFKIDISAPSEQFEEHLAIEDNNRIIFSGIFGSGKTYFLEKFFEEKKDKYLWIRLTPVNYSVATNEDIFKFVKYDILQELNIKYGLFEVLKKDFEENYKEQGTPKNNLTFFIWSLIANFPQLFKTAFFSIPEVSDGDKINFAGLGALVAGTTQVFEDIFKNVKDLKEKLAHYKNTEETEEFIEQISQKYLYERDPVTIFITEVLKLICEIESKNKKELQKVLIIDDLDRIDPEHIFRLFNVFSSHFNYQHEYENKFDFDKIIFVCDIDNIRKIFSVRYGTDTDFSGYIDKFYSKEIFNYNIRQVLRNSINDIFKSINVDKKYRDIFSLSGTSLVVKTTLQSILLLMIDSNAINLRTLLKFCNKNYIVPIYNINIVYPTQRTNSIQNTQLKPFIIFDFLHKLFGNTEGVINAFKTVEKYILGRNQNINYADFEKSNIVELVILIDFQNNKFTTSNKNNNYSYQDNVNGLIYKYEITPYSVDIIGNLLGVYNFNGEGVEDMKYFTLLIDGVKVYKELIKLAY